MDTYDVLLVDLGLPDSDGLATFWAVYERTDAPIVVLTAEPSLQARSRLIAEGAQDCIYKPELTPDTLLRSLRFAMERHRIIMELRYALKELQSSTRVIQELVSEN